MNQRTARPLKWFYCRHCGNSYQATQAREHCTPQCREENANTPNAQLALDMLRTAVENVTLTKLDPTKHGGRLAHAIRALTDKLHSIHTQTAPEPPKEASTAPTPPTTRKPCGCKDRR